MMSKKLKRRVILGIGIGILIAASTGLAIHAQKKLQKSPGGYHGELDFPISWDRYYAYTEWTKIMHDIQKKYPHLSEVQSIGKSRMGRDQYLITITAKSTGPDTEKPAMWVDGAVHGNEVNSISCSLYMVWYLLTRYDYDAYVHDLVNNCTFYVLPGLNVDANASFVEHPNTPNNPREPFRPEDNDGDGLYDEDRTEDVDGDGELSVMYIEDPRGEYKLSPDKRRFIRVEDKREEVLRFRRIGSEGFDNDGDGLINEDDIGGPDPNRNYPSGWNLQAGNPYPMSEFCTRNAYTFMLNHPNIFAGFHFHNTGRLIMFTTPPRVDNSRGQTPQQRTQAQQRMETRLALMRESNKWAQVFDIQVSDDYQEDLRAQTEIVTMGARILKNYRPTPTGGMGQAQASTYDMLGAYSYLIELWGSPVFAADENDDGRISDEELVKWIDIELMGEGWINPYKFRHPDLGEIWMGGSTKKHISRTPPARYIKMEAEKNAHFVMYCASQFPKIEFDNVEVTPAAKDMFWIEVTLKNDRIYPSISDRSLKLKRTAMDVISFSSSNNIEAITLPQGTTTVDPVRNRIQSEAIIKDGTKFRLKGKSAKRFSLLVKMSGKDGWVEFKIDSENGGHAKKRINLKVN